MHVEASPRASLGLTALQSANASLEFPPDVSYAFLNASANAAAELGGMMLRTQLPVKLDAPSVVNVENAYLRKIQNVLRATRLVAQNTTVLRKRRRTDGAAMSAERDMQNAKLAAQTTIDSLKTKTPRTRFVPKQQQKTSI